MNGVPAQPLAYGFAAGSTLTVQPGSRMEFMHVPYPTNPAIADGYLLEGVAAADQSVIYSYLPGGSMTVKGGSLCEFLHAPTSGPAQAGYLRRGTPAANITLPYSATAGMVAPVKAGTQVSFIFFAAAGSARGGVLESACLSANASLFYGLNASINVAADSFVKFTHVIQTYTGSSNTLAYGYVRECLPAVNASVLYGSQPGASVTIQAGTLATFARGGATHSGFLEYGTLPLPGPITLPYTLNAPIRTASFKGGQPIRFARGSATDFRGYVSSGILASTQTIFTIGSTSVTATAGGTLNSGGTTTNVVNLPNNTTPSVPNSPPQRPNPSLWPDAMQKQTLLFTGIGAMGVAQSPLPQRVTLPAGAASWLVVLAIQSDEYPTYTEFGSSFNDTVQYNVSGAFAASGIVNVNSLHNSLQAASGVVPVRAFQGLAPVDLRVLGTVTADPSKDKTLTFNLTITNVADGMKPTTAILGLLPVELRQHPITATSGTGDPPVSSGPIRFCRWIDAYPNGDRDNSFADKDRDRFQIRIPTVVPNLTKMRIKATELHGALINGVIQNKITDGDYEVNMKPENGAMVSEPILLVSVGDDDVTFNGKGTDDGKNDQTLLADFGSKIIVTYPELGAGETTFQAQQPIATVTLDMVYCHPLVTGAVPIIAIPGAMMDIMKRQALKIQEIYRQIGFKVNGTTIANNKILTFPDEWLDPNGTLDPRNNLSPGETASLQNRVRINGAANNVPATSIRVGFVEANLRLPDNSGANGISPIGFDPVLVSLQPIAKDDDFILSHEVGHALGLPHNVTYAPKNTHWLMFKEASLYWTFDSTAPIRWHKDDAETMKNKAAPRYVKTP